MTRHDDRDRIAPVRGADCSARGRPTDHLRDISIAPQLPVRDSHEGIPDAVLKRRAVRGELDIERAPLAGEILTQLRGDALEQRRLPALALRWLVVAARQVQRDQRARASEERQLSDR